MRGYHIKSVGTNRGKPRIWLEGSEISRAGLKAGDSYSVTIAGGSVILRADPNGNRVISRKSKKNGDDLPIIDLNSAELLSLFEGMSAIRMVQFEGEIYLSPIPTELRKKDRLRRLRNKLENGEPLTMGSMSHGGGVLSHAVHAGLEEAGVPTKLAWANEIRPELLEHASKNNSTWTDDTVMIAAPMQEFAFDQRAMSHMKPTDIVEAGWPCSGASKAGRAKRGTSMPEEHPEVGHLVVAGLMIVGRANPAIFLLENVIQYASSASAAILRSQLRDLGYNTHETILRADTSALENRERWCLVAVTEGLDFSWDMLQFPEKEVVYLSDVLDDIPLDSPMWSEMRGLKAKEERDKAAGKGFIMQVYDADATKVNTITKGYAKVRSTDPKLRHPENPDLLRQFTPAEHARIKQVPPELIEGLSATVAHELLGQGINYEPFRLAGQAIADCILTSMNAEPRPTTVDGIAKAMAEEMMDTAGIVVSQIIKPLRGVTYSGPITVSDMGMAIQDIGAGVGVLYKLSQITSPDGRTPGLGDNVEITQRLGRRMEVTWLDDKPAAPAVSEALQGRLKELGFPPIEALPEPAQAEPEAEQAAPAFHFGF